MRAICVRSQFNRLTQQFTCFSSANMYMWQRQTTILFCQRQKLSHSAHSLRLQIITYDTVKAVKVTNNNNCARNRHSIITEANIYLNILRIHTPLSMWLCTLPKHIYSAWTWTQGTETTAASAPWVFRYAPCGIRRNQDRGLNENADLNNETCI